MENLVSAAGVRVPNRGFWRGRRVLLTGHTGFKGSWLGVMLAELGAEVHGFALPPEAGPSAYAALDVGRRLATEQLGDLRDQSAVDRVVTENQPEIVFHLGAQALVGRGLRDPVTTFQTNVGGTVNLLDATLRHAAGAVAVIVTSDKVYRPGEAGIRHKEGDPLGGSDPYSASKASCELAVAAYRGLAIASRRRFATVRAGNVIGGGDFAEDRLIPDIVRADGAGLPVLLRRPSATRPFQHVLDVLIGYMLTAEHLADGHLVAALNFGPADGEISVAELVAVAEAAIGRSLLKKVLPDPPYEEVNRLALDSSLATQLLGWRPRMTIAEAVEITFRWYRAWAQGRDTAALARHQLAKALSQ